MTRATALILVAIVLGCGAEGASSDTNSDGESGAEGEPPPYHESLEEQLRPLCEAACEAHQQGPSPSSCEQWCSYDTVASCTIRCLGNIENTDVPCGTCLIEQLSWEAPDCFIGGDNVICSGGFAGFPIPDAEGVCADACADVLETWENETQTPDPIGFLPWLESSDPTISGYSQVAADSDGSNGLVATSDFGIHRIDHDGQPTWAVAHDDSNPTALGLAWIDAGPVALWRGDDANAPVLAAYDLAGQLRWSTVLSVDASMQFSASVSAHVDGMFVVAGDGMLLVDPDGATLGEGMVPWLGTAEIRAIASDGQAGIVGLLAPMVDLHQLDRRNFSVVAGVIELAPQSVIEIGADVNDVDEQQLTLWRVALGPDGSIAVGGDQRREANLAGGGTLQYNAPWVAAYAPDGTRRFTWRPPGPRVVGGSIDAITISPDGQRFLTAGTEDPSYDNIGVAGPLCSPDGCDGIAVHAFDAAGLLWSYEHRQALSWANSAVWTLDGDAVVVGRDTDGGLLLRFTPN